jgi:tRNA dimethylallyltransferase
MAHGRILVALSEGDKGAAGASRARSVGGPRVRVGPGHDARLVLVIAGPTASGKSALALAVAEAFAGVVINADSMQLYRELDVLTARPSPQDVARVPHRLYGVISAADPCSAGLWRAMALGEIAAAHERGRFPILVGGTGLYLKAVMEGLAPVPEIPRAVRAAAVARHARLGADEFHAELRRLDPVMAARLRPEDTQRVIRAYEVVSATGRSLADWQETPSREESEAGPRPRYKVMVLDPPRAALYAACEQRLERMVRDGAVDEVRRLEALGLDSGLPVMKAVGVAELGRYVRGELTLDAAVALARQATRRYAKRQVTWFRHQIPGARRFGAQYSQSLKGEIFSFIVQSLLTPKD